MTLDSTWNPADQAPKVIGLGAPISVRISFEPSEIPALIDAIDEQIGRYGNRPRRDGRGRGPAPGLHQAEWSEHIGELRRMHAHVEQAAAREPERLDVVWSTVLAHDVVHAAVGHARRRAAESSAGNGRAALVAAERTQRAFDTVDSGGLDAVWL